MLEYAILVFLNNILIETVNFCLGFLFIRICKWNFKGSFLLASQITIGDLSPGKLKTSKKLQMDF